jgi:hypothetical protein
MKGRITIEVDFDNYNEPYIQIICPADSEDVRDKLIQNFAAKLGNTSKWLTLEFASHRDGEARMIIRPIWPGQLENEAKIMIEQARLITAFPKQDQISH